MERFVLRLMQGEVALQCKFVLLATEQLQRAEQDVSDADKRSEQAMHDKVAEIHAEVDKPTPRPGSPEWTQHFANLREVSERYKALDEELRRASHDAGDQQWLALQSIVVSAANLSKLLWGSRGKAEALRAPLRASLEVGSDSCLRSPDLRNDFEHFDERIERWFATSEKRDFFGRSIGQRDKFLYDGDDPWFGHYDPTTGVLSFWANAANIVEIFQEAPRILPIAEREAAKHHVTDE